MSSHIPMPWFATRSARLGMGKYSLSRWDPEATTLERMLSCEGTSRSHAYCAYSCSSFECASKRPGGRYVQETPLCEA